MGSSLVTTNADTSPKKNSDLSSSRDLKPLFFLAWLLCAIFYFFQYAVRSAPGIMQEELTAAWGGIISAQ